MINQPKNPKIVEYQRRCFNKYKAHLGLTPDYQYLYGNPVQVLVPIETEVGGVMIVGAYPSAKFFTVNGISDVPLMDNDAPFSSEIYFDGSRVRTIPSGRELEKNYLSPLGIERQMCWITDLVKVFLFKDGHIDRYRRLGAPDFVETRSRFREFALKSLPWLAEEIRIAQPKVVLLLGAEVVGTCFGLSEHNSREFLDGSLRELVIVGAACPAVCLPHPGIVMRSNARNPWPERFRMEILPRALESLNQIGIC